MRDSQWIDSKVKGGPEEKIEEIIKAGWPFNTLGRRLKVIEGEFKEVRNEYDAINDSIKELKNDITKEIKIEIPEIVRKIYKEHATTLQYQWLVSAAGLIGATIGLLLPFFTNDKANLILKENVVYISPILIIIGIGILIFIVKKK